MPEYIVRTFKSWSVRNPEDRWANTYEFTTEFGLDDSEITVLVNNVVQAERHIHLPLTQFLSATVSTYAADSKPYNPFAFRTFELTGVGTRTSSTDALDSNVVLHVKREATSGKSGKIFYRGCLTEADVQPTGNLRFSLTPGSPVNNTGADFVQYSNVLEAYAIGGINTEQAIMVLIGDNQRGPTGTIGRVMRPVRQLVVGGVTVNRRNHAFFNKS